jgi:hypothetical protein
MLEDMLLLFEMMKETLFTVLTDFKSVFEIEIHPCKAIDPHSFQCVTCWLCKRTSSSGKNYSPAFL